VDSVLAAWTQLIRHMTGRYDVLERVRIEYPSIGQDDLFESWFRCPVEFGAPANDIRIKDTIWGLVAAQAQKGMNEKPVSMCDQELEGIHRGSRITERAGQHMAP